MILSEACRIRNDVDLFLGNVHDLDLVDSSLIMHGNSKTPDILTYTSGGTCFFFNSERIKGKTHSKFNLQLSMQ